MTAAMITGSRRLAALVLLWIGGTSGIALAQDPAAPQPDRRPNILLILTDDQRWDALGCAGNPIVQTPAIDALAADGVRFRNAFVTTAICAASRASILTGLYERTHGFTFGTPPLGREHIDASYPALLRVAGYRTGFVGKFGIKTERGGPARMFDSFVPMGRNPYMKKQPDGTERHLTDITGDRAIEFLDGCKPEQPWCLSISFNAPHAEDSDPRQYIWPHAMDGWYDDAVYREPVTMAPEFFAGLPEFLRKSESRVRFRWRFDEPQKYQDMVRGYYRMISGIDAVVGRLRRELRERGLADSTVIVFTSDNGYFLGERGFADKWYLYDPSVRVPLVVVDPRLPATRAAAVSDLMALNIDLAPTILDLAGIAPPERYQGRSLVPLLRGKAPVDWRTEFFYEHLFHRANIPKSEGLRSARWTYVRWFEQQPLVEELYDHLADPDEACDLVADPAYAEVLAQLRRRTDELRDRYGGPFVRRGK